MPKVEATRELLASQEDVWRFLSEPHNLPDWWPGLTGVQPDRRRVAPGARWHAVGDNQPTWFRRPNASGMLLVRAVEPPRRLAWHFTGDRIDVDLRLEAAGPDRTLATLTIEGPYLIGLRRSLPQKALGRLHALCQTAAEP